MDNAAGRNAGRFLWWVAGADRDILAGCPKGDQLFISHLGIALECAFLFVFFITSIAINVAFPHLSVFAAGWAVLFAALIGTTIFLIDRSFIISDWDWQASVRRDELARAGWETLDSTAQFTLPAPSHAFARVRRSTAIIFRLLLSVAIGYSIASFLELVIYKDEIRVEIEAKHYRDNKAIYDRIGERQHELAYEIDRARENRDRLQTEADKIESEVTQAVANPPKSPSQQAVAEIDVRLAALQDVLRAEELKARTLDENIVAERFGTKLHDGNTGIRGEGRHYQTNVELKRLSDATIAGLRADIARADADRGQALRQIQTEAAQTAAANDRFLAELKGRSDRLGKALSAAQAKYEGLVNGRGEALAAFTAELKTAANFVPISYGVASQFHALRALYAVYGNWAEFIMIKALIILLELTPIIMKVFLSPKTLYAVRLDAKRRESSYADLDAELALRQQHLRKKFDAAIDERMDERGLDLLRKDNVTPFVETRGAG